MGRNIDSKNEYFSGIAEYDRVTRTYNKNFDFFASAGNIDETLILKEIHLRSVTGIKANPNFYYYGDGGTDTLEYMGDDLKKVVMTAHSSYDFYLTGGYDRNPGGGWDPDSLDVFTDDVERFVLTQNNDDVFINGASFSIYLDTREGNDEVESTRYADEIWAGSGNDTIESGGGGDTIYGEAGNDRIYADADRDADDVFNGGDDNDSIYGYGGNDVLDGGEGADTIYGGDGEDIIHSGGLKDETGANHLYGGGGADLFIIGNGKNDYTDSFTFDFSEAFSNGEGSWTDIMDSAGTVMGAAPQLKALGSGVKGLAAGFDLFYEATSNGTSNVSFELTKDWNSVTEVQVKDFNPFEDNIMIPIDLDGSNLINYAVTWDEHSTHAFTVEDQRDGSNFQILTVQWADNLADYVPDYMTSGGDGEILIGTYYNALQNSLARSHLVYDGDAMYLGGDHLEDGLAEDANTGLGDEDMGFMSIGAYGGWEIYADNDSGSTFMGTTFDDTLGGFIPLDVEEYSPALAADAKAKTLFGMAGDDLLFGGAGNDTINGGEELDGSSGSDTVAYFEADFVIVDLRTVDTSHLGIDYAVSNAQYTTYGGDVKNDADVLYDIENVIGSDGNDTITGDGAQNYLYGQGGNDVVEGGGGVDIIYGNDGNDTLTGGSGTGDQFYFDFDDGNNTITDLEEADLIIVENASTSDISVSSNSSGTTISFGTTSVFLDGLANKSRDNFKIGNLGANVSVQWDEATGSSSDESVICTYMYQRGYIPADVYKWDGIYGQRLGAEVLAGYHAWAIPLVEHVLKRSEIATQIVRPLACAWAQEMAHRCDPETHPKGSRLGAAILTMGVPLCRAVFALQNRHASTPAT